MRKWLLHSYTNKLYVAFILIWLVPILLFIGFDYYAVSTNHLREVSTYAKSNLRIASQLVENDLSTFIGIVNTIAGNEEVIDILCRDEQFQPHDFAETQRLYRITKISMAGLPQNVPVHIITDQRDTRYSTTNYSTPLYNNRQGNLYEKMDAYAHTGKIASQIFWRVDGDKAQDISYVIGRAVIDPDSEEIVGYVVLDIFEHYFQEVFTMIAGQHGSNLAVVDSNMTIICDSNGWYYPGYSLKLDLPNFSDNPSGSFTTELNGGKYILFYDTNEKNMMKVIELIPITYFVNVGLSNISTHITFFLVLFLLGFFVVLVLAKRMTVPFKRLKSAMERVGEGDYATRVSIPGSDEIATLGNSFNTMAEKTEYLIKENYEKQLLLQTAELKALRAQTNPHFLYNCLNSISMMVLMQETDVALKMVQALSRHYRNRVKTEAEIVTIGEEVEEVRNYLTIQSLRFKDKLTVEYDIQEKVLNVPIPRLILQPIVENAIIHGVEQLNGDGVIGISICERKGQVIVRVSDNGLGPGTSKAIGEGTGLSNTEQRLRYHYGDRYTFRLTRTKGRTVTTIIFPNEGGC